VPATAEVAIQTDLNEVAELRETVRHQNMTQQWLVAAVMALQQRLLYH
jgi:outer membrane receptor for monomeric catechols